MPRLGGRRVARSLVAVGVIALPLATQAAGSSSDGISLRVGQAKFWDGGFVSSALTTDVPGDVACSMTQCFTWKISIPAKAWRLRVALDTPSRKDTFTLELKDPAGVVVASRSDTTVFNEEVFAHSPAAGTWTVRVIPRDDALASFRMRAKLENAPVVSAVKKLLLPNLQATPPYEFGFVAPANPANGLYPPDTVNPPLDVLGYHPVSCTVDETANTTDLNSHPTRCLRFTTGPRNAGVGKFEVHYNVHDPSNGFGVLATGPAYQWIYYSDGSHIVKPAGVFQFHPQHGHYHYNDILNYQLYKVTDPVRGTLVIAGKGVKSGFCPADELFADWRSFDQQEGAYVNANCGYTPTSDGVIGQSPGWGDVYRYQRPGQFVDFGTNADGLYVVRVVVDIHHYIRESNQNDNAAYAYLRIVGDRVSILERGQGLSPWDPAKKVFTDQ